MTGGVEHGGHRGRSQDSEPRRAGARRWHLRGAQAEMVVLGTEWGPAGRRRERARRGTHVPGSQLSTVRPRNHHLLRVFPHSALTPSLPFSPHICPCPFAPSSPLGTAAEGGVGATGNFQLQVLVAADVPGNGDAHCTREVSWFGHHRAPGQFLKVPSPAHFPRSTAPRKLGTTQAPPTHAFCRGRRKKRPAGFLLHVWALHCSPSRSARPPSS